MGYGVDTGQLQALSQDIGRTGAGLRSVAEQVARAHVADVDFGGDRYQDYGASYLDANRELGVLADQLATEIDRICGLLRDTTNAYDQTESDNDARINSSGAGLRGGGA